MSPSKSPIRSRRTTIAGHACDTQPDLQLPTTLHTSTAFAPLPLTTQASVQRAARLLVPAQVLVDPLVADGPLAFIHQSLPDLFRAPFPLDQGVHPPPVAYSDARIITLSSARLTGGLYLFRSLAPTAPITRPHAGNRRFIHGQLIGCLHLVKSSLQVRAYLVSLLSSQLRIVFHLSFSTCRSGK